MINGSRRVAITGLGVISPIGLDVATFWRNLCEGKSGAKTLADLNTDGIACKIGAPVPDFDPLEHFTKKETRKSEPFVRYGIVAARQALEDSHLQLTEENRLRVGTVIGTGIGGIQMIQEQSLVLAQKGPKRVSPFFIPRAIANMAAGAVSIDLGLKGPSTCVVTACATGTNCIGDAMHIIKRNEADVMLTGGTESAVCALALAGFSKMNALTRRNDEPERASRPFDAQRDGFLIGEGAGILVLEELERAKARNAPIYGELIGYGMSSDAFHITAPDTEGDGAARCMQAALDSAGIGPDAIDYINAHGTSTPQNDAVETLAIKRVFGRHAYELAVSSNKSMTGHLLGAAGGVEAIASVLTVGRGVIPPTINYEYPDPDCDLDYVPNTAREQSVETVLSNSLGFGGHNSTIVIRRFEG